MDEPKYIYVVSMVRTTHNDYDFSERKLADTPEKLAVACDSPVEAAAYAMRHDWYPFCVERFEIVNVNEPQEG